MRTRVGKALIEYKNYKIEYRYFDDYNELVGRLPLLVSSQRLEIQTKLSYIISVEISQLKIFSNNTYQQIF